MTATNHALTGAVIGLAFAAHPALAIPAAFLSHFVLDAIPHFALPNNNIGSARFRNFLLLDMLLCVLLVTFLFAAQAPSWWFVALCAFLATSPDLMWAGSFVRSQASRTQKLQKKSQMPLYMRLHAKLQWFERPIGGVVEAVWLVSTVMLLSLLLK